MPRFSRREFLTLLQLGVICVAMTIPLRVRQRRQFRALNVRERRPVRAAAARRRIRISWFT